MNKLFFTVFTPTYNRADLLHRVYDSLVSQCYKNFEWLIIDDGSTDDTDSVVEEFISKNILNIRYIKKKNEGKVAAINDALMLAKGFIFVTFDSDDWCDSDALQFFHDAWVGLSDADKVNYCGISALKRYTNGKIVGEDYSRMQKYGESYVDRHEKRIRGDKWEALLTDIHKKYKYDIEPGDRYMAPEYAWFSMGMKYKTVFIDRALSTIEYQSGGISMNNVKHRVNSARSALKVYKLFYFNASRLSSRLRAIANANRFAFHSGEKLHLDIFGILTLLLSYVMYVKDKRGLRK